MMSDEATRTGSEVEMRPVASEERKGMEGKERKVGRFGGRALT